MTKIHIVRDYPHPAERVWLAKSPLNSRLDQTSVS